MMNSTSQEGQKSKVIMIERFDGSLKPFKVHEGETPIALQERVLGKNQLDITQILAEKGTGALILDGI